MKAINIATALVLLFSVFSCKNEEKIQEVTPETTVQKPAVNPNVFSITLKAIVKKDDSFQVYFKDNEQDQFEESKSLYVSFKGSDQIQDIIFNLPEDAFPKYFRLDYGINKEQSEIVIKEFKLQYLDKSLGTKDETFFNYFIPNEQTMKVDKKTLTLTPFVTKDGNYDPMSYTGEGLYKHIQEILLK